jgi:hypothetical protein
VFTTAVGVSSKRTLASWHVNTPAQIVDHMLGLVNLRSETATEGLSCEKPIGPSGFFIGGIHHSFHSFFPPFSSIPPIALYRENQCEQRHRHPHPQPYPPLRRPLLRHLPTSIHSSGRELGGLTYVYEYLLLARAALFLAFHALHRFLLTSHVQQLPSSFFRPICTHDILNPHVFVLKEITEILHRLQRW